MLFDKEVLTLKETDTLWKFYQKRFILDGAEIAPPKNLCNYFWTAVMGFGFWITREIKLWKLSAAFLASIFLIIIASPLLTDTFQKIHPYIGSPLFLIAMAPLFTSMLALALASRYRMTQYIDNSPRLRNAMAIIFGTGMLIFIVASIINSGLPNPNFEFGRLLSFMITGIILGIILVPIAFISFYIWTKIPGEKKSNFAKAVKTFFAALKAKKRKVCPLVEPPPEFQKK